MKARQLRLDFSAARAHWAPNLEFAQTQNASSLMPAHVEPFLIKVMKEARGRLCAEHSDLLRDIDTLIRQETQHYVQHQRFNERCAPLGIPGWQNSSVN